jgi:hypothetical protein
MLDRSGEGEETTRIEISVAEVFENAAMKLIDA